MKYKYYVTGTDEIQSESIDSKLERSIQKLMKINFA